MAIVEVLLGAFLAVLFERLASREFLNLARKEGIQSQVKEWRKMLVKIQIVLFDAEDREMKDDALVEHWLEDLRDLAYDLADILDEFTTDALIRERRK